MALQISPGVNVSEIDLTTVVPSVLTTAGAFAGSFAWGPANKVTIIDSEITLSKTFGQPDSNTSSSFYTAANFLAYGNNLCVVRSIGSNTYTAQSSTSGPLMQVANDDDFEISYLNNSNNSNTHGPFIARCAGNLGNSLSVEVCANTSNYNTWTYKNYFTSAPGTSDYVSNQGGSNDELHIVVVDKNGLFTGTSGTVLETYGFVSKAIDATVNNDTNYYKQVIFNKSKFIFSIDHPGYTSTNATWGQQASGVNFASLTSNISYPLSRGMDGMALTGNLQSSYDLFKNKDSLDISLILTGDANVALQQYIIDNLANQDSLVDCRRDCVVFISPPKSAVVGQTGNETTNILDWLNNTSTGLKRSSSYVFVDSGWKYQYDKYNNVYRYVPLNGDIAGLCVYTDTIRDPWFSPAGLNRGQIKNAVKLAWNPSKTYRDTLYAAGVNSVVSLPGQGIVLYGDKTLTNKPSAFDRINVRRLFITLEKSIAQASKFSLFELNDEFTRAQFVALVTPFLRDVQGRHGITDFKVVCDTTNNTPAVIDNNKFVGDIYIKPARSINYIQLNFVAVGTGVDFTTVVGAA